MPTIEEKLKRYAELKIATKKMEDEMDELNPEIKEYIFNQKIDKLPTSIGTFSVSERGTWKYSPAVEKLQEEEKAKGIAKQVVSTSLKFTPAKAE